MATHPKSWHVIYTRPRWEKKLHDLLIQKNIESFLPLYKTIRIWSDRKKKVELPLFNSYLFVNISGKEYYEVLNTPGAVKYIYFEGKAAIMSDKQIEAIKLLINSDMTYEVVNHILPVGSKVIIVKGALQGLEGEIVEYKGSYRACIRVDQINRSVLVNVPAGYYEKNV
jgi:transcription antitermination factor NusG